MAVYYNVRLVPERNSNSKSLTVLFSDLLILSMTGESNRNSKLSDTQDIFNNPMQIQHSVLSDMLIFYAMKQEMFCSFSVCTTFTDRTCRGAGSMTIVFQHGIMKKQSDI